MEPMRGSGSREVLVPSESAGNSYTSQREEWDPPEVAAQHLEVTVPLSTESGQQQTYFPEQ